MKIAQVCPRYYPNIGGIETHVQEISERLAKKFDVEVITADLTYGGTYEEEINQVKIRRFHSVSPGDAYFFSPQIWWYLKNKDFDIIHAHNYHAFPALFASLTKKGTFVFSPYYHGKGSTFFRDFLNMPYKLIGSKIFKIADRIISVSEFEKELIKKNFSCLDDSKIIVIPSGVNIEKIKTAQPFDFDGKLILYIGRLDQYKNIDLVVRAMKYLPDFKFYIIGKSGNYKQELLTLIKKMHMVERVKILDTVPNEEKYRWLKTCSLFINLSDIESFGITILEALCAGKSIIVNDAGGLGELAQKFKEITAVDRSAYSDELNLKEFAAIIKQTSGKTYYHDLAEYSWDIIAQRIEEAYLNF